MATTFCDNDAKAEPITVSQPGGTFNTVPGLDGTKLTFTPATAASAGPGPYQIIYTAPNGVASDPVSITLLPTPVNTFTVKSTLSDINGAIVITAHFTPDKQDSSLKYQWQFGSGFNTDSSNDELPQLTVVPDPNKREFETTASLTVFNGNCSLPPVTKNLMITGKDVIELPTNTGSILSGIKNLFNKKG